MRMLLAIALFFALIAPAAADRIKSVVVSGGSNAQTGGDFFPTACDGNIYKLVEKQINGHVTKAYLFIASPAPAIDAWLYTDHGEIVAEVHRPAGQHPVSGLRYWEAERDFGNDSMYVGKLWILVMCYPVATPTSIEPYAIIYTREKP